MFRARFAIMAAAAVLLAPSANAQILLDENFDPTVRAKPAKRPPPAKQPNAVKAPPPVVQPGADGATPPATGPAGTAAVKPTAPVAPPASVAPVSPAAAPAAGPPAAEPPVTAVPAKPAVPAQAPATVARETPTAPPATTTTAPPSATPALVAPVAAPAQPKSPAAPAPTAAATPVAPSPVAPAPAAPAVVAKPVAPTIAPSASIEADQSPAAAATHHAPPAAALRSGIDDTAAPAGRDTGSAEPASPPTQTASLGPPKYSMPPPAKPANCKNTESFPKWLSGFRKEASAEGISPGTISDVLDGMALDQSIINRDRGGQKVFTQSFSQFSNKLANPGRYKSSVFKYNKHKALFQKAESEFGVPGPVITAFWALESDFGSGMGNLPILRSLATLAYDCRRGEMFREELMAALKLIDRGDFHPNDMVGSWAGEIGQTQFLPGHVLNYAIDYDGDGRSDLYRNNADIIGTTANFIRDLGWRAGEPWLQEVQLTKDLPWQEADLAIKHPIDTWSGWGVKQINGAPLAEAPEASLVLPMGRRGPAFLVYPNFGIYTKWNQSLVYALTAAHLATRIAGGPPITHGDDGIPMLDAAQVKELQTLLNRNGWNVGEPDGKLGAGTRAAVKQAQLKFKMPADSFPNAELVSALRGGG